RRLVAEGLLDPAPGRLRLPAVFPGAFEDAQGLLPLILARAGAEARLDACDGGLECLDFLEGDLDQAGRHLPRLRRGALPATHRTGGPPGLVDRVALLALPQRSHGLALPLSGGRVRGERVVPLRAREAVHEDAARVVMDARDGLARRRTQHEIG